MIAVVDDDVSFAEEIQDLLASHGHRSVVVVTHPQASSLALLDDAKLLILDLALAATNALDVLEELRRRGSNPLVVMVSGSGSDELEAARNRAVDRGFAIVGALSKPVAAAELLDLLFDEPGSPGGRRAESGTDREVAWAPACGHVLVSTSLDYAGSFLGAFAPPYSVADPERWLARIAWSQRALAERGRGGFVVAQLPNQALSDRGIAANLCLGLAPLARSRIVLELGSGVGLRAHADTLADLRLAGYGLLLRFGDTEPAALADLPVTIAAVDVAVPRNAVDTPRLGEPLRRTIDYLGGRSIASLCTGIGTSADLQHARAFGFNLVCASFGRGPG